MSIEENKRIVVEYLTTNNPALASDDLTWWTPATGPMNREQFTTIMKTVVPQLASRVTMTIDHITAEGDRVAVEAHGHAVLTNGQIYANTYHFLYILRDGKIIQQREHADSAYAYKVLGPELVAAIEAIKP